MEFRLETLNKVINLVAPRGLLILDDINRAPYGPYAINTLKNLGFEYYSLLFYTIYFYGDMDVAVIIPSEILGINGI